MKTSLHVFPDTNVFLHYPPLSNIEWCELCNVSNVQLVICLPVVHELDAKKGDSRFAGRAERSIKEIREAHSTARALRVGVTLTIYNQEVRDQDFPTMLSSGSGDDRIVHLARLYREQNPENDVAIATEDLGMELRCEAGGVPVVRLDKAIRLENPQDELTKKYKQAVNELNSLKHRLPKLHLSISKWNQPLTRETLGDFVVDDLWQHLDIPGEMEILRGQYPNSSGMGVQSANPFGPTNLLSGLVSQEQWKAYDRKLEEFFEEYRKYLEGQDILGSAKSRCIEFSLALQNDGKGLATDVDILVRFPRHVRWVSESGSKDAKPLERGIEPPEPPEQPQPLALAGLSPDYDFLTRHMPLHDFPVVRGDEFTPDASVVKAPDDTYEIHVRIGKVKHGHSVTLGNFLAVLSSWEDAKPFEACCTISASELTEKSESTLPVIVRRKSQASHAENVERSES